MNINASVIAYIPVIKKPKVEGQIMLFTCDVHKMQNDRFDPIFSKEK